MFFVGASLGPEPSGWVAVWRGVDNYRYRRDGIAMQVNIYLPDELAERVRAAEGLNVSQVCQTALREELQMIDTMEVAKSGLEKAAVRLRKSHGEWDKEMKTLAVEYGADFAKDFAESSELVEIDTTWPSRAARDSCTQRSRTSSASRGSPLNSTTTCTRTRSMRRSLPQSSTRSATSASSCKESLAGAQIGCCPWPFTLPRKRDEAPQRVIPSPLVGLCRVGRRRRLWYPEARFRYPLLQNPCGY